MKLNKEYKFRNKFANTSLGKTSLTFNAHLNGNKPCALIAVTGEVTQLGHSECEIEVRENWGIRVVVRHEGMEKVVWGHELKRSANHTPEGDDPYAARNYHKQNRRLIKDIKVGTVVQDPVGQEYVSTKVLGIVYCPSRQLAVCRVVLCPHSKMCTRQIGPYV